MFAVRDGRLATESVGLEGVTPEHARAAYLAALNEDLTTFRHNVSVHLAMLTSFALASTNHLEAAHPVRRLLHHCFHTVLIGNVEFVVGVSCRVRRASPPRSSRTRPASCSA